MSTKAQIRPVRIFSAMPDGPLPKSIKQVLSVIGNEDRFCYVDSEGDADLVLITDVAQIERGFTTEKSYGLLAMPGTRRGTLPDNVVTLGMVSLLVDLIELITRTGQNLRPLTDAEAEDEDVAALLPDAKRILVIDDTPKHIASAKRCLAGHHLTTIASYREAMKILASEQFDIVLTDLHLPMSSETLGAAFKLGELVPYGLLLMIEAARQGAKHVAVVTDLGHHDDPFSAAFDYYSSFPVQIEGARVMMLHARVTDDGKDWSEAMARLLG